jgi:putative heme utilization carrier protein HutX
MVLESLPEAEHMSMAQIIECLPESMWKRLDGERFVEILGEVAAWGGLTTIVHTEDVIMEFSGTFPEGSLGHGYYNLHGGSPLHGHLRADRCGGIYLVERPFMGTSATASLQFMNKNGQPMFKIYLGRDENKKIHAHQLKALRALVRPASAEAA